MRAVLSVLMLLSLGGISYAQDCRELRQACMMKDQLGERGQGNCRRYREACQQPQVSCMELRARCMFKDELGEQGQGNCRRYRQMCGG
ncbi:hypothetical protein [Bradyrhizobium lablabi]|uniref:hypothetical protein n=1 Tax=Bradyrhizobium lablabi TaxID=722472 RepID=UPI001BA996BA|nr:hypothetical protein [Bradyrhizobium lablabi]MBR0696141.1 hypothetical protein [Bradyrhizobium lablabi]